jgi:hypothetical protein
MSHQRAMNYYFSSSGVVFASPTQAQTLEPNSRSLYEQGLILIHTSFHQNLCNSIHNANINVSLSSFAFVMLPKNGFTIAFDDHFVEFLGNSSDHNCHPCFLQQGVFNKLLRSRVVVIFGIKRPNLA